MAFIELSDIDRRPVTIAVDEISSVTALRPSPYTNAVITMRNGDRHEVTEDHRTIMKKIVKTGADRP